MSRWATSLGVGPLTLTRLPRRSRPGAGMALWAFMIWTVVVLLQVCWWLAKWIVVAAVFGVAAVVALVQSRRS